MWACWPFSCDKDTNLALEKGNNKAYMFQRVVEIYLVNLPLFSSATSRYLVTNKTYNDPDIKYAGRFHPLYRGTWTPTYQKNTPSDQRRRKRFTHPRRIDHIPTFASLNHDKNTRSTHYTPNAGIEFAQAGFAPPGINLVQNCIWTGEMVF